ncbi:Trace amine-associated receptor 1 [Collichthys lucidus]|uniref:Trace amine-associated receptor 1 n=1 Tax=Collichthys lucidus TaxID=240159 RepID=A0A4U5ULP5_COLLU|nr:Trace amine-associated receptor 1 [Collichthys lucidus]
MEPKVTINKTYTAIDIHPCYEFDKTTYVFTSNPSISCVLLYIFLGLFSVVTICGNLLVIISVIYFKQLHMPTNYLILSLAMTDLLVGVLVCPFSMAFTVTSCLFQPGIFCKVRGSIDVTLSTASILNLCFISIDRYFAVCQPLTYRSKINDRVIGIMIFLTWGVAALIGIGIMVAFFLSFNQQKTCEQSCLIDAVISTILACVFSFYLPAIIMLSIYLKIFLVAQSQANSIQSTNIQSTQSGIAVIKMERKATKTLAIVMGVFLLCWTPFFLSITFNPVTNYSVPSPLIETLVWLGWSNSMFNPFVYGFFYSWFRSAFRIIISGKIFYGNFTNSKLL